VALPSGESIAGALGLAVYTTNDLKTTHSNWSETPLWLYVLAEAEVQQNGERLGEVGGRIVAEVIFELLRQDPTSFLSDPKWRPELAGPDGRFGIAELLKYSGVA
jgi:hypothetical protein